MGLTGDGLGRTTFAGGDHDEHLHETVVNLVTAALYNKDILIADRGPELDRRLAIAEFGELAVGSLGPQPVAYSVNQQRMGGAREDLDSPHHVWTEFKQVVVVVRGRRKLCCPYRYPPNGIVSVLLSATREHLLAPSNEKDVQRSSFASAELTPTIDCRLPFIGTGEVPRQSLVSEFIQMNGFEDPN